MDMGNGSDLPSAFDMDVASDALALEFAQEATNPDYIPNNNTA